MRSGPTRSERKTVREAAVRIVGFFENPGVAIRSQNGQSAADGSVATTMVLPAVLLRFRHIARWVDSCSKVWRIVELSTTASDAVDGMETGWAEPHFGGSDRPKWAKNTTLPRRGSPGSNRRVPRAGWSSKQAMSDDPPKSFSFTISGRDY